MKQKGLFIFSLLAVLVIGIGGFLYQENYLFFADSATGAKNTEVEAVVSDSGTGQTVQQAAIQIESEVIEISAIDSSYVGKTVTVQGLVASRQIHSKGHVFLTVKDETGELSVPLFADKEIDSEPYQEGKTVNVTGKVQEYQGKYEVVPALPEDIHLETALKEPITEADLGKTVVLKGEVVSRYEHPDGHLFLTLRLTDGQELEMPIFNSLKPDINAFQANAVIEVEGEISEYKGNLQVIPSNLQAIKEITAGELNEAAFKEIDAISAEDRGQKLLTEGNISDVSESKDGHLFFTLEKDGKKIETTLFKADTNELEGRKERILQAESAKFPVRIVGVVEVYEDQLTLIVDKVLID
ncbi:exodeoxyribonuclease VII large subunit [Planomicrobium sp. CPCC 101110]|uniref:exodeoxyribonuclease VII large subunit n=1 Tax=Planomicrobium sp. CPCC 101110 TaxID=2599619 RepID=UPI00164843B8|nr:exodeoxyribonuclease VII large subunit [Planomicrobium sp. CPCC 101110]